MKSKLTLVVFIFICCFRISFANEQVSQLSQTSSKASLRLTVLERGSQIPLKEVNVYILPDKIKAETNNQGVAQIDHILTAESQVVVSVAGYLRYEKMIDLKQTTELQIYLEKEYEKVFETVVTDQKNKKDLSQKTLTRQQFLSMPGANGDPLKAIQNLPGINRSSGFSSQVIIQGSAPKDTAYDFEGHRIPIAFHFGGLSSVVMPEAIEQVDYFSAGYEAERSQALGGVISIKSRKPEVSERARKGLFYADNLSAGGLYEQRIDDQSSFLISGRYSYIGFFLKNAVKDQKELNLTVAPEFQDLTAIYHRQIASDEEFKLSLLGSRDRLAFVLSEPFRADPSFRGQFSNTVNFYRLIPSWTKKIDSENNLQVSLGVGRDETAVEIGEQYLKIRYNILTTRADWEHKLAPDWKLNLGIDDVYQQADVDVLIPLRREAGGVNNPISVSEKREAHIKGDIHNTGMYLKNKYDLTEKWDIRPGLRFDYFSQTHENFLLPRLSSQYRYLDDLTFKMGSGLYAQPPEAAESSAEFGNPDIHSPRALHFTIGFEKDNRQGSREGNIYSLNYFDRWFDQLVIQSSDSVVRNGSTVYEIYNNQGRGRAYGVEAQMKFLNSDYEGFLSYTWSRSTRWNPKQSENVFQYDQTHNFNLVAAHEVARNWKLSSRFRYVTGNPSTPVVGATYDSDNEVYIPQRGALYSTRFKDFYQLDLRIDRKIISDKSIWSLYLDVQNVLNTKNPETLQYAYDYSTSETVNGLPILPSIGVKGEF